MAIGQINDDSHTYDSIDYQFRLETLPANVENPWAIAFLPDGRLAVSEHSGFLRILDSQGQQLGVVRKGMPNIRAVNRAGLLDIEPHPDFADNQILYFTYVETTQGHKRYPNLFTALASGRLVDNDRLEDVKTLWRTDAFTAGGKPRYGSRIAIHGGYIYFTTGDRERPELIQRLDAPHGKVMRLNLDGSIPEDNPLVDQPNAIPAIWTIGHRNPQGLTVEPKTGLIYATEHGPRGGDELNVIVRGGNYGWPLASYGTNYDLTTKAQRTELEGTISPIYYWSPSLAVCGIEFHSGETFGKWNGDLLLTSLAAEELRRVKIIKGARVIHQEVLLKFQGRIRDVAVSAAGEIFLAFNNRKARLAKLVQTRDNRAHFDALKESGKRLTRHTTQDDAYEQKFELRKEQRLASQNENLSETRKLVALHCASCHGRDLSGGSALALVGNPNITAKSAEDIARIIEKGLPESGMPPMGTLFTIGQLDSISKYILTLREDQSR